MTISALVIEPCSVRLWGLDSTERLRRQLREMGGIHWLASADELPPEGQVLLLDGRFLFEIRTLKGLLAHPGSVLIAGDEVDVDAGQRAGRPAAALVDARQTAAAMAYLRGNSAELPRDLRRLGTADLEAFNETLRSARPPLLEPIRDENRQPLENLLYGNAYRGITDLVTKFVWPRPARQLVHLAARLGLSPNGVTSIGLVLVLLACWAFYHGHYAAGLAAGWLMTLLDTVDGKLARVTIQSSPFGHLYDHAIDLIHPPFWYIFWGVSLGGFAAVPLPSLALDVAAMSWWLVAAYVGGRVVEGLFPLLGDCSIFTWRPFDAWFRLVTARRNPCLIILTLSLLAGRPDWGFVAVVGWSVLTTGVLLLRLLQGLLARLRHGRLQSWLSADNVASGPHAASYRVFGATRGAYGN